LHRYLAAPPLVVLDEIPLRPVRAAARNAAPASTIRLRSIAARSWRTSRSSFAGISRSVVSLAFLKTAANTSALAGRRPFAPPNGQLTSRPEFV